MTNFNTLLADAQDVRFFSNALDFGLYLASLKGHQFLSFSASYDMDAEGKMLKKHRSDKTPNPYLGVGLRKEAKTTATVCFDYCDKVDRRGGELPAKEGNWLQAVVVNGKLTPLSTHKADVKTQPKAGAVPKADGSFAIADLEAVMDENGSVQFVKDNPRLYLRYEIVRFGPLDKRGDKQMKSESRYVLGDGAEVPKKSLEPYLPVLKPRTDETDVQCAALDNVTELTAGGQTWRRRTAALTLPTALPALV